MKILLLTAVIDFACTEKLLENYRTLYLAADDFNLIKENEPLRILVRHILQYNNYDEVFITFYIRQNDGCQLYTLLLHQIATSIIRPSYTSRSLQNQRLGGDAAKRGFLMLPVKFSSLPGNWVKSEKETKISGPISFLLYPASNTTVIMSMDFVEKNGGYRRFCAAFSKETTLSKELWDIYVRTTADDGIPRENIRDILKNGFKIDTTCYISVHGI